MDVDLDLLSEMVKEQQADDEVVMDEAAGVDAMNDTWEDEDDAMEEVGEG